MRNRRVPAALLSLVMLVGAAPADPMDGWAKAVDKVVADLSRPGAQNEFDQIFGERLRKAGRLLFADEEYSVMKSSFGGGGGGWNIPEKPCKIGVKVPDGPQLYARWTAKGKSGAAHDSLAVAVRFTLADPYGEPLKTRIGEADILNSDPEALIRAWYREWVVRLKEYREPKAPGQGEAPPAKGEATPAPDKAEMAAESDRKTWREPGKKQAGIARFSAGAQGTEKDSELRWRREWYGWADKKATYIVFVRIGAELLVPNGEGMGKGKQFVEAIREFR